MDLHNLSAQSELYKQEMMKLYSKQVPKDEAFSSYKNSKESENELISDDNYASHDDETIFKVDEDAPDDTSYSESSEFENNDSPNDDTEYNNRYPEPDLTILSDGGLSESTNFDSPPVYVSEDSLGNGRGFILVNVRTGDESTPVEGATVMVTAIVDGSRLILAEGLSDNSGTTKKFVVPAPDIKHSQAPDAGKRPYNLFDVSVTANGFFKARSVDVPVFDGITSVQNFNMIPVPLMMGVSDETITYFNQEPDFNVSAEK